MKVFPAWFWPAILLWTALGLIADVLVSNWAFALVNAVGVGISVACIAARHKEVS